MKILTANWLRDGSVIYLKRDGEWSTDFAAARLMTEDEAAAALADANSKPRQLVGAYLVEIEEAGVTRRERLREAIRAAGPTVGNSLGAS